MPFDRDLLIGRDGAGWRAVVNTDPALCVHALTFAAVVLTALKQATLYYGKAEVGTRVTLRFVTDADESAAAEER